MKNLLVVLACLFPLLGWSNDATNEQALTLVKSLREQRVSLKAAAPLVKFIFSGSGKQGEPFSIFLQQVSDYTGANTLLDAKIDGNDVTLEHPDADLWIYRSSGYTEIRSHEVTVNVSIEDTSQASVIRSAIKQLDREIDALQVKIDRENDPVKKAALIAQRDEKISIRSQLTAALAALKTPIGVDTFSFSISEADPENEGFAKITGITPAFGYLGGGATVTLAGTHLPSENFHVLIGGEEATATAVSAEEMTFVTPAFGSLGVKDIELRVTEGGNVKNTFLKNAYFVVAGSGVPGNARPVAYAGHAQSIAMGQSATLDGGESYDLNGDELEFEWRVASVAPGSEIPVDTVYSTSESFDFTPDVPGSYILELVVREASTFDHLESLPSMTVVTMSSNLPPEIPVSGPHALWSESIGNGIPVSVTFETNEEVIDPDGEIVECEWEMPGGIIRYGNVSDGYCHVSYDFYAAGEYTVKLTVKDNNGATASVTDTIEVFTDANSDGRFTVNPISGASPLEITADASAATNPSGMFDRYRWRFGDSGQSLTATAEHTYAEDGVYNVRFDLSNRSAAGNSGIWRRLSTTVYVGESAPAYGAEPISVLRTTTPREQVVNTPFDFNGTSSFDPDAGGSIALHEWLDIDGEWSVGSTYSVTPTEPGNYYTCMHVTDQAGGEAEECMDFFAVTQGKAPRAQVVADSLEGEAPFTVTFNAKGSYDADGTIAQRVFNSGEEEAEDEVVGETFSHTFTAPGVYTYRFSVTDNDGNKFDWYEDVFVNEPGVNAKKKARVLDREDDRERERLKRTYVTNCARGDGRSCFNASKLYEKEGNTAAAHSYRTKACNLGVQEACEQPQGLLAPIKKLLSRLPRL